jgi:DNA-binding transcriptional LysR family regulator
MAKGINPADLGFFSALIASGSLSAAARELGVTTAAVSKHLSQMETRLGTPLVNRTTRRMSLTHEGEIYLEHARKILGDIDDLEHVLWGSSETPRGLLRVNATLGFGRSHIAPLISRYVKEYPLVDIQLQLSVNPPSIADDVYDVCFRFGHPPDSRAIARLIAPNKRILVASPSYIKQYGEPKVPSDLIKHNCIGIRQGDEGFGLWRFSSSKNKVRNSFSDSVKVRGNLTTNDGGIAVNWALDGRGILLRAQWDVEQHIQSGRLIPLMKNFDTPDADIYAVYAQRHKGSVRVKSLIEFAVSTITKK